MAWETPAWGPVYFAPRAWATDMRPPMDWITNHAEHARQFKNVPDAEAAAFALSSKWPELIGAIKIRNAQYELYRRDKS